MTPHEDTPDRLAQLVAERRSRFLAAHPEYATIPDDALPLLGEFAEHLRALDRDHADATPESVWDDHVVWQAADLYESDPEFAAELGPAGMLDMLADNHTFGRDSCEACDTYEAV